MHKLHTKALGLALLVASVASPAFAQSENWPDSLTIGTASQGGTYFIYGTGLGGLLNEHLGVPTSAEVTNGPVQNVTLVETGDHDIGLITMLPAYEAMMGESELAPGVMHENIRALFPMYQTPFHGIALSSSGIDSLDDLEGRRVSVGPAGSTGGTYFPKVLEALGISAEISYAGAGDAASQLKDGLIDAFVYAAGAPVPAFSQVLTESDAVVFGFTDEQAAQVMEAMPALAEYTLPGGSYPDTPDDVNALALWNFAIAHQDMPEDLAYEITKFVMENNDRMMQIHATASETIAENVDKNTVIPFHPGALRYFDEIGADIADDLRG